MDEALEMLRSMWTEDHITRTFPIHGAQFASMRTKPQPVGHLLVWIGGHGRVAIERAASLGDGRHGAFLKPEQTKEYVSTLRLTRAEPDFVISMRTSWDSMADNRDKILSEFDVFREAGVIHFVPQPRQQNLASYLRSIEVLAELMQRAGASFDSPVS
jgi:alkanesulfonate monooxygenase SsuD/methylene tetrahydromethanopterin reductase-like flavin-dependent oxidoreductase (luciferase family)